MLVLEVVQQALYECAWDPGISNEVGNPEAGC
jgi:hypothetical protein